MYHIGGIQQVGVGVPDARWAFEWFQKLGFALPVFHDKGEAALMQRYTGNAVATREAVLAINTVGGGGLEIWQYINRTPRWPSAVALGSPGICAVRLKCRSLLKASASIKALGIPCSDLFELPNGTASFAFRDYLNNLYTVVEQGDLLHRRAHAVGGVCGAIIGCSSIERALPVYRELLGYDQVRYDITGPLPDAFRVSTTGAVHGAPPQRRATAGGAPPQQHPIRRVLLERSAAPTSPLSPLYGSSHIELWELQRTTRPPPHIFATRQWGDIGFIHLCFEVRGLDLFRASAAQIAPVTVDSKETFRMGEAGGRFAYIEDPDGTLIELVETHRITVSKRWGIGIDLKKRAPGRPLSRLFFRVLSLGRKKLRNL